MLNSFLSIKNYITNKLINYYYDIKKYKTFLINERLILYIWNKKNKSCITIYIK